jgi:hypothetical protein
MIPGMLHKYNHMLHFWKKDYYADLEIKGYIVLKFNMW